MTNGKVACIVRRAVSLPISQSQYAPLPSSQDTQVLFHHDAAVFSLARPLPAGSTLSAFNSSGGLASSILPSVSAHDKLLANGKMEISSRPNFAPFITVGSLFSKPILRNTHCWSVDGPAKFIFSGQSSSSWLRLELRLSDDLDYAKLKSFTDILAKFCQFETTVCPFDRAFSSDLPPQAQTRKKPWSPRISVSNFEPDSTKSMTYNLVEELASCDAMTDRELRVEGEGLFATKIYKGRSGSKESLAVWPPNHVDMNPESSKNMPYSSVYDSTSTSHVVPAIGSSSPFDSGGDLVSIDQNHLYERPLITFDGLTPIADEPRVEGDESVPRAKLGALGRFAQGEDIIVLQDTSRGVTGVHCKSVRPSGEFEADQIPMESDTVEEHRRSASIPTVPVEHSKRALIEQDSGIRYRGPTIVPTTKRHKQLVVRASADSESLLVLLAKAILVLLHSLLFQIKTRICRFASLSRTCDQPEVSLKEDLPPSVPGRWVAGLPQADIDEYSQSHIAATNEITP